jgi:hypothetical protein
VAGDVVERTPAAWPRGHRASAAAQPGNALVVRAGTYASFHVDKGVRVLADPGVTMSEARLTAAIVVENVPPGQADTPGAGSPPRPGARVDERRMSGSRTLGAGPTPLSCAACS